MRMLFLTAGVAIGLMTQMSGQAQTPVTAPAAPRVQLTFEPGGNVTLVANGATVREILAEWTRKGGTPFVGVERLSGSPLTLQFEHRPEAEVMASLLRGVAGYVIGPREAPQAGTSELAVVYVLATSSPSVAAGYGMPTYVQPQQSNVSTPGVPDTEIAPVGPGRGGPPPQPNAPPPLPEPAPRPAGVSGVAVPVVPVVPVPSTPPTTTGRGGGGGGGGR